MKRLTLGGLFGIIVAASACDKPATAVVKAQAPAAPPSALQASTGTIAISVDATGYHPDSAHAPAGRAVRLVFTRTTDEGCGQQLVFPALGIRKDLPLNQSVDVDITMPASGSVAFTCGMNMFRGSVVAQ
jgi:plastocyanin domain-containing protein